MMFCRKKLLDYFVLIIINSRKLDKWETKKAQSKRDVSPTLSEGIVGRERAQRNSIRMGGGGCE